MNKLRTDYPCDLKLWLVYFVTIYVDKKGLNVIFRNLFSFLLSSIGVDLSQPEVIELELQMTPLMISCQAAILDLLDACVKELKRGNPTVS